MLLILSRADALCNWLSGQALGNISQFAGGVAAWIERTPVLGNATAQNCLTVAALIAFAVSGVMVWRPAKSTFESMTVAIEKAPEPQRPDDSPSVLSPAIDLRRDLLQHYFADFGDRIRAACADGKSPGEQADALGLATRHALDELPMTVERMFGFDERKKFSKELASAKRRVPKYDACLARFVINYLQSLMLSRHLAIEKEVEDEYRRKTAMLDEFEAVLKQFELELIRKADDTTNTPLG